MANQDKEKLVLDTNIFMNLNTEQLNNIVIEYKVIVPFIVLQELDNLKINRDNNRSYKARKAIRFIKKHYDKLNFIECDNDIIKNDDKIIDVAMRHKARLATLDICMEVKAKCKDINVIELGNDKKEEYKGYRELYTDKEKDNYILADIYKNKENNLNLYNNEYLLVKNKNGTIVDKMKCVNNKLIGFNNKTIKSKTIGNIKPLDTYQSCLIDSLVNNQMSLVKGKPGSGKTLISLAYALSDIEKNKYNKLIIFANPVSSRNSARLGFYPGTRDEKVLDSFVGSLLASKLGGMEGVYQLMGSNKLEILPFSDIRGFDTSGMNAIVYIIEAQNLSIDLMKLAIQRVSDDCKLIIDGDYNAQVDMKAYEGTKNGMRRVSEAFRGQDFYGEVELQNIYRSKMARVADSM